MPTINIQEISRPRVSDTVTYTDISMDARVNNLSTPGNLYKPKNSNDIEISKDSLAIMNSLTNIFNTTPGQKVLNPEFGLDLKRFLFEPLTDFTSQRIAETILDGLTRWEPRVEIVNINVLKDIDNWQFEISLTLSIPSVNNSVISFTGILSQEQFTPSS